MGASDRSNSSRIREASPLTDTRHWFPANSKTVMPMHAEVRSSELGILRLGKVLSARVFALHKSLTLRLAFCFDFRVSRVYVNVRTFGRARSEANGISPCLLLGGRSSSLDIVVVSRTLPILTSCHHSVYQPSRPTRTPCKHLCILPESGGRSAPVHVNAPRRV
eukprot:scaffold1026_cov272-Pinguiococcus_pyrenoidosus.AAC.3